MIAGFDPITAKGMQELIFCFSRPAYTCSSLISAMHDTTQSNACIATASHDSNGLRYHAWDV